MAYRHDLPRPGADISRARELRRVSPRAERLLWEELRGRRLGGFKFVRQAPIGPFFADFLCRERMLVVEIDGGTHSTPEEIASDKRRTGYLSHAGYRVLRVQNDDVYNGMDGVLSLILERLR